MDIVRPVPAEEVADAVRRAGRENSLLGIGLPGIGTPAADTENVTDAGLGPEAAGALVGPVGERAGAREPRVAASLTVLGYSSRVLGPVLALWLREGMLLDAGPGNVAHAFAPGVGLRLSLRAPAAVRGPWPELAERLGHEVVTGHLGRVIAAVRSLVPVSERLLWGNVASSLAGALGALVRDGSVSAGRAVAVGSPLLGAGPLTAAGRLAVNADRLVFVRSSCCLYYRIAGSGLCADCPLPEVPGRRSGRPLG